MMLSLHQSLSVAWRGVVHARTPRTSTPQTTCRQLTTTTPTPATLSQHARLSRLIREFESNGHNAADLDPLRLNRMLAHGKGPLWAPSLRKETHGFVEEDMDMLEFDVSEEPALRFLLADSHHQHFTLRRILAELERRFSGKVGIEFAHLSPRKVEWIRQSVLSKRESTLPPNEILGLLVRAQVFEEFCSSRYSAATHFSLDGAESLIPGLESAFHKAAELGVVAIEMGMAHRGRLNVLKNVLHVPLGALLDRFESYLSDDVPGLPNNSDDVRYHLGASVQRYFHAGSATTPLRISLAANPSHLEAVNGVVLGKARARQFLMSWGERTPSHENIVDLTPRAEVQKHVLPLLLHGDASFFQGSVRESLGFSQLKDYATGGTLHVIVNNQIGFTTLPKQAHSGVYCSDVAKSVGAPVFHVNADSPEDVSRVFKNAVAFRQEFLTDVVVNFWCYRRRGHNERDAPEVTSPVMYAKIKRHPQVSKLYAEHKGANVTEALLVARGEIEKAVQDLGNNGNTTHTISTPAPPPARTLANLSRSPSGISSNDTKDDIRFVWNERQLRDDPQHALEVLDAKGGKNEIWSGFDLDALRRIGRLTSTIPGTCRAHPKVKDLFDKRLKCFQAGVQEDHACIKWDLAESLAFYSLLVDGVDVRLAGQDVERGTFNQRHAVLYASSWVNPSEEEDIYQPWTAILKHPEIGEGRRPPNRRVGMFAACNSPLSEESVLAFEHGYTLYSPSILVVWEAQFGDFADCAQTVIDTFISSGEEKWVRQSGLVMFLPHGYDGQGPDHSSAFMERFLSLASEDDAPTSPLLRMEDEDELDPRSSRQHVNMHIANPSTPAQLFHLLRRHMIAPFRKPLVVFTPKFLLHHGPCVSPLKDFGMDKRFNVVLESCGGDSDGADVKRIVLCTGKIYYHLVDMIEKKSLTGKLALVRVEQLCPFPFVGVEKALNRILAMTSKNGNDDVDVIWAQEEPKNRGAWSWIHPRVNNVLENIGVMKRIKYIGRPPSASPATGSYVRHKKELERLLDRVIGIGAGDV